MALLRIGLPAAIAVAGGVLIIAGNTPFGIMLLGIAVIVLIINLFVQLSFYDQDDRDRDEEARVYYDEHGHWPNEN